MALGTILIYGNIHDPDMKLREWDAVKASTYKEYIEIIDNKQKLTTEFENYYGHKVKECLSHYKQKANI